MTIVHRPGLAHSNVDPISRNPVQRTFVSLCVGPPSIAPALLDCIRFAYPTDDNFGGYVASPPVNPFSWTQDGFLFRAVEAGVAQLCIPQSCRLDVIRALHNEMGHPGARRTLMKASTSVFWPKMSWDIELYCRSCHSCQIVKTDTSRKPGTMQPIAAIAPFHTMCIDFMEGLPPCGGGVRLCRFMS